MKGKRGEGLTQQENYGINTDQWLVKGYFTSHAQDIMLQ